MMTLLKHVGTADWDKDLWVVNFVWGTNAIKSFTVGFSFVVLLATF
jgi:hypothetical protein